MSAWEFRVVSVCFSKLLGCGGKRDGAFGWLLATVDNFGSALDSHEFYNLVANFCRDLSNGSTSAS